jgi:hypothetical protein
MWKFAENNPVRFVVIITIIAIVGVAIASVIPQTVAVITVTPYESGGGKLHMTVGGDEGVDADDNR